MKGIWESKPENLNQFLGQDRVKESLIVTLEAAKRKRVMMDHVLFEGPAGLGKTTLVNICVNEMGARKIEVIGGMVSSKNDVYLLIEYIRGAGAEQGSKLIVFIDEIHRIPKKYCEVLYSVMQDFQYEGEPLPRFTLIGATTSRGMLPKPFRDRFKHIYSLSFYDDQIMAQIVKNIVNMPDDLAMEIARRAQGVPRVCKNLLTEVMNTALVRGRSLPTKTDIDDTFHRLDLDEYGLGNVDREIVKYLFEAGHASEVTLRSVFELSKEDLSFLHEMPLIKYGLLQKTNRGRMLTARGKKYAKDKFPELSGEKK